MKKVAAGCAVIVIITLTFLFAGLVGLVSLFSGAEMAQKQACSSGPIQYEPVAMNAAKTSQFKDPDQIKNIQIIKGIGVARKLSQRDIHIALIVAIRESRIRNLTYGDGDSLGIFQQRPSVKAWGTASQIMDPVHATNKFYDALEQVKNRESKMIFDVATDVQHPNETEYAKGFDTTIAEAAALLPGLPASTSMPVEIAPPPQGCAEVLGGSEKAVQAALSQHGKPYRWTIVSPTKPFDSAELTQYAYAQAGVVLPASAEGQYKAGQPVPKPGAGSVAEWQTVLQRGDLLFWADVTNRINHVSLYLGNGQMLDAKTPTAPVSVSPVPASTEFTKLVGATRPAIPQATNADAAPTASASSGQQGPWQWPLKPPLRKTSPFGMRFHPIRKEWRMHNGTDFGVATGTPVFAAHSGTVTFTGHQEAGGNVVTVDHGGGVVTQYLHLSAFSTQVGAKVTTGQQLALSGNTGWSTGPHLHFIVKLNGTAVDPVPYLKQFGVVL